MFLICCLFERKSIAIYPDKPKTTLEDPVGCKVGRVDEKNYMVNKVLTVPIISKTSLVLMLITHLSIITSIYKQKTLNIS